MLNSDYGQVQKLVEEAVRQLSAAAVSSAVTPLDKCQLMEQMNDNHVSQLLPRLRACDDHVAAFAQRCLDDKVTRPFLLIHTNAGCASLCELHPLRCSSTLVQVVLLLGKCRAPSYSSTPTHVVLV